MSSSSSLSLQSSSTSSSGISFQGITSGLQTSQLVQAEITQASGPLNELKAEQTANTSRSTALTALGSLMTTLSSSIATLNSSGLTARTVTSTDPNNAYITATASGGASGSYTMQVIKTATAAEISPTLSGGAPTNLSVATANSPVFNDTSGNESGSATFALQDTNGNTQSITLTGTNNTLQGLANAINAKQTADPNVANSVGLGIQATVVNTGSGTNPYELILTSTTTGSGKAGSNIGIAETTTGGALNTLGIPAGSVSTTTSGGTTTSSITGGLNSSAQPGQNAVFTLDGVQLTRSSNTVSDAVNGVTFNLVQGGQTGTTTLTVTPDATTATADMNTVLNNYNSLIQAYNTDSAQSGPLSGDFATQGLISQISQSLTGRVGGLSTSATYNSASSLGLSTNEDGTLSLDTSKFQTAFQANPTAALNVFATSGTSTNASVSLAVAGPKTATGKIGFNITSYSANGNVAGTLTAPDGTQYNLTGSNGVLQGAQGTPLDGLYLGVTGVGSGTLTLSRGVGQAVEDTITHLTAYGTGSLAQMQKSITSQNTELATQIASQQQMLNTMQTSLENKYSAMEATLSQLQAAGNSINSLS
ncbi:MAG: flagellar filament capping protein FliD [Holophaga sp.]|nr:flagellar filament capping protein FliD [Holophaga sp.]